MGELSKDIKMLVFQIIRLIGSVAFLVFAIIGLFKFIIE